MKSKKTLLLSLGVLAVTVTPLISVISCGNTSNKPKRDLKQEQKAMDSITMADVKKLAMSHLKPNLKTVVPGPQEGLQYSNFKSDITTSTGLVLKDAIFKLSAWVPTYTTGTLEVDVLVTKEGLQSSNKSVPFNITLNGWQAQAQVILTKDNKATYAGFAAGVLTIHKEVTQIGPQIFAKGLWNEADTNTVIRSIDFSQATKLEVIDNFAFSRSDALHHAEVSTLTIPSSVQTIGSAAFDMSALTSLTFQSGSALTTIGDRAFSSAAITTLSIPIHVTTIEHTAFFSSKLEQLTIPNSVTTIGNDAFFNIKNDEHTHVSMPTKFNNISTYLPQIFGVKNFEHIEFNWT